jgi:hypothetical protein
MSLFRAAVLLVLIPLAGAASRAIAQNDFRHPSSSVNASLSYATKEVNPSGPLEPLTLQRVISQKVHAGGGYDITLPVSGPSGIECRRSPVVGEHTLIFIFSDILQSGNVAVTGGVGSINGAFIYQDLMVVPLSGVANAQTLTLTLTNVTDRFGQTLPTTSVSARFLLGDTNGDGSVNAGDALQTKNRSGQDVSPTNFRSDVNTDGTVNTGDAFVVRSRSGDSAGVEP